MADANLAVIDDETALQILGEAEAKIEDPELVSKAIVARILQADTVDSVFDQGSVTPARDVLDQALHIIDVRWNRSSFEDGASVYALIDAADAETGEVRTISCGARNVMAQLYRLKQLGELTKTAVKIVEAGETASGYRPMWLQRA